METIGSTYLFPLANDDNCRTKAAYHSDHRQIRRFSAITTSSSTNLWSFSRAHICANDSSVNPDAKHTSAKQSMEEIARSLFPLAKVAGIISQFVI